MNTSENGILAIKAFERKALTAYQDGGGVWTIGFGRTKNVKKRDKITLEQANAWLLADVAVAEAAVDKYIKIPLLQNQFDMLVSATFNCGEKFVADADMQRALIEGNIREAAALFVLWSLDDGVISDGLLKRRAMESRIFQQEYTPRNLAWIVKQNHFK